MRVVEPYARLLPPPGYVPESPFLLEHGLEMLRRVEWCARISHRTEEKQDAESYRRFLRTWVLEHGDYSTIEHCVISADVLVDRGLSHELVRHRIAAYTQESTRFVNYGKREGSSINCVLPEELREVHRLMLVAPQISPVQRADSYLAQIMGINLEEANRLFMWYESWFRGALAGENEYLCQLRLKVPPELARDMLPHCLATRMVMTHNLRGWRHLMLMRTSSETHRKLRPLMGSLLQELQEKVPVLFEDIVYGERQASNLRKGR